MLSKGVFIPKNNKLIASHLVKLLEIETLDQWPEDVEQPITLLAYKITQGTQRIEENVKKAAAINNELVRVAEVQQQHIEAITPRRLFNTNPLVNRYQLTTPTPTSVFPNPRLEPQTSNPTSFQPARQSQVQPQTHLLLLVQQIAPDTVTAQIATYEAGSFSRELTSLAKLYTSNDLKYSSIGDNFDYKFKVFLDHCRQAALPKDRLAEGISMMLRGQVLDYYFTCKFRS